MKKSITNNDTIAFCHHLNSIMTALPTCESITAARHASEAWRMLCVAVKFHWNETTTRACREAVVRYMDEVNQDFYAASVMGNFLNDTFRSFTGKACKEV